MATLKVRVRAATGGPTLRVQLPQPCTLQALKDAIASQIGAPASSFHVSLNKKDSITGPSADVHLSALGVINGDLLYYVPCTGDSVVPNFSAPRNATPLSTPTSISSVESNPESPVAGSNKSVDPVSLRRHLCAAAALQRTTISQPEATTTTTTSEEGDSRAISGDFASCSNAEEPKGKSKMECTMETSLGSGGEMASGSGGGGGVMEMEIEEELVSKSNYSSLPDLLQRVLLIEYEKVKERQAVLVLAIHAVMLETGFVLQHPMGAVGPSDRCGLPADWSGKGGLVNLTYTLPEIIRAASASAGSNHSSSPVVGDALLRCQVIGNALVVYGVVTGGQGGEIYRLSLPVSQYLHKDFVVEENGNAGDALKVLANVGEGGKQDAASPMECEGRTAAAGGAPPGEILCNVYELWKQVKDNLSLPLLTCMCEKAGLQPPASLSRLPTELKIKVLENLPAASLARIGCVCSELKFLANSEELWKVRFKEEFGDANRAPGGRGWKAAFARELARRRRREEERREAERQLRNEAFPTLLMRPPPISFPGVLGGDYDRFPGLGNVGGFRPRGPPGGAYWSANFPGSAEPDGLSLPSPGAGRRSCEIGGLGRDSMPSLNLLGNLTTNPIIDSLSPSLFGEFSHELGDFPP